MATHGVKQLSALTIAYCKHGGSSRHIRSFLSDPSGPFTTFAASNPTVTINVVARNGKHPYVRGEYVKGWDKTICVKNEEDEIIMRQITKLNNSSGRKMKKFKAPVESKRVSIQGTWSPLLRIGGEDWRSGMEEIVIENYGEEEADEIHAKNRVVGRGQFNNIDCRKVA